MGTNWKELNDITRMRSGVYGLLSSIFREEPSEALILKLREPRWIGALSDMDVNPGDELSNTPVNELVDLMALEFTRLFIGPGPHISAHESIFCEVDGDSGGLWGEKTVEVKKFIETTGLEYASGFSGLPDHISVELDFMLKLTEWEADKWSNQDKKNAEYCLRIQRMFLEAHLLCWAPAFCDAVMDSADMAFYRSMAEFLKVFLAMEKQTLLTESDV